MINHEFVGDFVINSNKDNSKPGMCKDKLMGLRYPAMDHGIVSLKMLFKLVLVVLVLYVGSLECETTSNLRQDIRDFPDGFIFGAASAAYQVEGAWNEDGKSESIWDHDTHQVPSPIDDQSNGDVAGNSYYLYKRDVEMVRELGLDFYRFSLAWTRIIPTGFPDKINQAGVDYYNNLIDELLRHNIQPMVTLFHWDLPLNLQQMGGWTNAHSVDWYSDYARIAFKLFGDRVKYWITINEPTQICYYGYGLTLLAPRLNIQGVAEYICSKYLLLAHAKAYHIYDQEFRAEQEGTIFITLSAQWYEPDSESDKLAAHLTVQFDSGIYAHPIFSEAGDWPPIVKEIIANKSAEQGFARSRLPEFTPEEIKYLRGSSDLFGLNHYSSYYVSQNKASKLASFEVPSRADDIGTYTFQSDEWAIEETDTVKSVPWGFYKLLMHFKETYGNPPIMVTENGLGSRSFGIDDDSRVTYYKSYVSALLDAIADGADIRGYTAWCLMDNFEWSSGYSLRYGLYEVDYSSPQRTRTPRKSAFVYKEIVRTRTLDPHYEPDTTHMTIDEGH